jgi:hypothetical protein
LTDRVPTGDRSAFSGLACRPAPTICRGDGGATGAQKARNSRPVITVGSVEKEARMLAVIGNVLAGLLAVSLFTATVRLSK